MKDNQIWAPEENDRKEKREQEDFRSKAELSSKSS